MRVPVRAFLALILVAGLAGCGERAPRRDSQSGQACLSALSGRGVRFESRGDLSDNSQCGIANAVAMRGSVADFDRPATLSCQTALAVDDFERTVVQPAAERYLGGPVTRIRVLSAYRCTRVNGSGRLSEHARGHAIDIAAFTTRQGTVTVKDDWRDPGPRGQFLRAVARGACGRFGVVLTPNTNRDHHDHFHLDTGPSSLCSL